MYDVIKYHKLRSLGLRGVDEEIPAALDPCWVDDSLVYAITETYHIPKYFDNLVEIFSTQIDQIVYKNFAKDSKSKKTYGLVNTGWYFNALIGKCIKSIGKEDYRKSEYPIYLDIVPFNKTINLLEADSRDIDGHRSIVIVVNIDWLTSELYGYKIFNIVNAKPIDFSSKEERDKSKAQIKVLLAHEFLHITERFFNPNDIDPVRIDRKSKTLMSLTNREKILETIGVDSFYRVNNFFYAFSSTELNARLSELHQKIIQDKEISSKKYASFQDIKDLMRSLTDITWTHIMLAWIQDLEKAVKEESITKEIAYVVYFNNIVKRFGGGKKRLKSSLKDIFEGHISDDDIQVCLESLEVISEEARDTLNEFEKKILKEIYMTFSENDNMRNTEVRDIVETYTPNVVFDLGQYVFLFEGLRSY